MFEVSKLQAWEVHSLKVIITLLMKAEVTSYVIGLRQNTLAHTDFFLWYPQVHPARKVVIAPSVSNKRLKVYDAVSGAIVRSIDLAHIKHCDMVLTTPGKLSSEGVLLMRFANLYDLVMKFAGSAEPFSNAMGDFLNHIGITNSKRYESENVILRDVFTKEDRQHLVEEFFRLLFRESLAEDGQPQQKTSVIGLKRRATKRRKQVKTVVLSCYWSVCHVKWELHVPE